MYWKSEFLINSGAVFLAHRSQSDMVSFCDRFLSGVQLSVNFYFKRHILINRSANFIQTSQECSFRSQLLKIDQII
jgi:hypothetical protein